MRQYTIQKKVGYVLAALALLVCMINFFAIFVVEHNSLLYAISDSTVWGLLLVMAVVLAISRINLIGFRYAQGFLFVFLSVPTLLTNDLSFSFFGLWFLIIGVVLLYKYDFFIRFRLVKAILLLVSTIALMYIRLAGDKTATSSTAPNFSLFLVSCLALLYVIFEENIRELLSIKEKQDKDIAEQQAVISKLEPLSVLGERVSHIAHSFKNNLTQVSAALYYLEHDGNPAKAADKMRAFSISMMERIDNVLMVSHAGTRLEPEVFDLGRLLDGIKLVYLEEKVFVQNAKYELDCAPGVLVKASRWDVILLLENLLKNAIEAIVEAKKYGLIAIKLQPGLLTVQSDGGPIKACSGCPLAGKGNCLDCPVFSKGGYTTKKGGSGTGLAQVFSAVRAQNWGIAVECGPETSAFKISFPVEAAAP